MRKLLSLALVAAAPVLLAHSEGPSAGPKGASSSAEAKASVEIVAPLYLAKSLDLNFGTVLMDAYDQGGSVKLTGKANAQTSPVVTTDYKNCAGWGKENSTSAAYFHFKKDKNYDVDIDIPAQIDLGNGVKVDTTTDVPTDGCGFFASVPSGVETKHFTVGGNLTIPANVYGKKSATFKVTVSYK